MKYPEYIQLFRNEGEYKIQVHFKDFDGSATELSMDANEIEKLIDPCTGNFYSAMRFDDWLFEVYKYEIDPIKKIVKIRARQTKKHLL
ncbi:hypothetical protein [Geothermobacter hydrogeniphilus]|uniref:Uncharacterized protein n=1 Tax=Geothermobacter hydrogeniphilus TaxID=1969733 RepID=A0A1X0XSS4_9BACT|nr:hypothetical protein [Geothermobacter hydrogeniphilus]ORJ55898.1 hypothetical protein B5V00_14660 [Geothermobacter hydrogeniphilus]